MWGVADQCVSLSLACTNQLKKKTTHKKSHKVFKNMGTCLKLQY